MLLLFAPGSIYKRSYEGGIAEDASEATHAVLFDNERPPVDWYQRLELYKVPLYYSCERTIEPYLFARAIPGQLQSNRDVYDLFDRMGIDRAAPKPPKPVLMPKPIEVPKKEEKPVEAIVDPLVAFSDKYLHVPVAGQMSNVESRNKRKEPEIIDVLYVFRKKPNDNIVGRMVASIRSLRAGTYPHFRICIADTSFTSRRKEIADKIGDDFEYCHRPSSGLYRRAWNINIGVKLLVESDRFLIADTDVLFPANYLEYCVAQKAELLATSLWALDEMPISERPEYWCNAPGTKLNYGGCVFMSRELYDELGGFDERYIGWGAEDSDFYIRAGIIGANITLRDSACMPSHMPHKQQVLHEECKKRNMQLLELLTNSYREGKADPKLEFALFCDD